MGKKLSAAQKQQISATLKRKWAEKKAGMVHVDGVGGVAPKIEFVPDNGREKIAAGVVDLLNNEISNLLLVRVVDRILRP